jgi:hypothetical protein
VKRNSPVASNAGKAHNTPPFGTSCAGSNWIGADSSSPMAAATRSSERVVAYPISASLSVWVRSLLLLTAAFTAECFF